MAARSCVIFLTGPHTNQQFISQVLSQFDANLSGDIPCCVITSTGDAPLWCGTESPGPASNSNPANWSTSLAGLKFDEEKLRAGSLDNVGVTLHNLLDEIQKYSVTHAVWITDQVPTAGASLILASGLMRFIKCHHGYLSIVTQSRDPSHSPWVKAMKAALLPKSDVHKLAKIISKCCWVADIQFRAQPCGVDMTLPGLLVMGKHTDFVTNGNLTHLSAVQIVNTVPLYVLKECVDVTTVDLETARRLASLSSKGILCKVTFQKDQGIRAKSDWIRAVQTRSIGNTVNTQTGPYVMLWRSKLYTFREVLQPPCTQKGGAGLINQTAPTVDWGHEQKLLDFFERAGSVVENTRTEKSFPVRIPSPRNIPAAASIPSPLDILDSYVPSAFRTPEDQESSSNFDQTQTASLSFREAVNLQTHGIHYFQNTEETDLKFQEIQRNYVHRETYCSLSPYNSEDKPYLCTRTPRPSRPSSSTKGKCKASTLDRSKSQPNLSGPTRPTPARLAKSTENLVTANETSTRNIEPSSAVAGSSCSGAAKPSRSQKNKTLLKTVIGECLEAEGISPGHTSFKSLSGKLYDICKMLLRDSVSGSEGIRDAMVAIALPQTQIIVSLERKKFENTE